MSTEKINNLMAKDMNDSSSILYTLNQLSALHYTKSLDYKWFVDTFFEGKAAVKSIVDLPYLPVRALKEFDLKRFRACCKSF